MKLQLEDNHTFTREAISRCAPREKGIYSLFRGDKCVYVSSGIIRDELLRRVDGADQDLLKQLPTHWFYVLMKSESTVLEKLLRREFNPICNPLIPKHVNQKGKLHSSNSLSNSQ